MERLFKIQQELKCAKNQRNDFGEYYYRSCEDIFEAVKPLLAKYNVVLVLSDSLKQIGERYYIEAQATLMDLEGKTIAITFGYAREEETKKKMDGSQITGASSSYARKYALNGLFLIDDVKDSDATNQGSNDNVKPKTLEDAMNYKLTFGKYNGKTLAEITRTDSTYANWLYSNEKVDAEIKECLNIIIESKKNEKINGD